MSKVIDAFSPAAFSDFKAYYDADLYVSICAVNSLVSYRDGVNPSTLTAKIGQRTGVAWIQSVCHNKRIGRVFAEVARRVGQRE